MALRAAELCAPPADAFLRGQITEPEFAAMYARAWHSEFDRRLRIGRFLQAALNRSLLADALIGLGRITPFLTDYLVSATRGSAMSRLA
jgi:hypothetical protein